MPSKIPLEPEAVADVIASVADMTLPSKEDLIDEMYQKQPYVLGCAVAATQVSSLNQVKDAAVEIALVVFLCLKDPLRSHGEISEIAIERFAERNTQMWRFLDGETPEAFTRSAKLTLDSYPEPALLGYLVSRLNQLRVEEPQFLLRMKTMLDVCVDAKWSGLEKTGE